MPTNPPRPVSRLAAAAAALLAVATITAAVPLPAIGADTAAACPAGSSTCGG